MSKKDAVLVTAIGAAVGLLAQPIISNFILEIERTTAWSSALIRVAAFVGFTLLAPLALAVAALIGRAIPVLYQFAKFAAVGSLNSFVDLGVFNLETFFIGALPTTAVFAVFKAISFLAATTNSFVWNKYWTFEAREKPRAGEVAKFYAIAIAGGLINVGVATLTKAVGPLGPLEPKAWVNLAAPIVGIFAALFWNFVGYKFFVFRKPPDF